MPIGPLRESSVPSPPVLPTAPAARPAPTARPGPSFAEVVARVGQRADAGEQSVRNAVDAMNRGRGLGAAELLALQACVYRYSEVVDLTSKLVERVSSGIKTVLQSQ